MILGNVRLINGNAIVDIGIEQDKITTLSNSADAQNRIVFKSAMAFPGLINSHDHLDFNLYPQLGDKTYTNYAEWGPYIRKKYKAEIDLVLKIPVALRAKWGMYKNLIAGVTTVVDHGVDLKIDNPLLTIVDQCQDLHSVAFEKMWKLRLNNPLKAKTPVAIHVGEGTDTKAFAEINTLLKWNLLNRSLIGIHGVAMQPHQAQSFKALVWCPHSNYFLLNKTAHVDVLKNHTDILFGTDSTLTSDWDIWEHLRLAQKTQMLYDDELYKSLTTIPAKAWKLNSGKIAIGKDADIVIARDKDDVFETSPASILMVVHQGNIRLFDEELYEQVAGTDTDLNQFSKIYIDNSCKYVQGDMPELIKQIKQYHPAVHIPVHANQLTNAH